MEVMYVQHQREKYAVYVRFWGCPHPPRNYDCGKLTNFGDHLWITRGQLCCQTLSLEGRNIGRDLHSQHFPTRNLSFEMLITLHLLLICG